jgi:hypothetical protein
MSATSTTATIPEETEYLAVWQGTPQGDQISPARLIKAVFDTDGEPTVTIRLFCVGDVIGVGIYPSERKGIVLRWHDGPSQDPVIIHWDADGPPCT